VKKIFAILFALVLVVSLELVTAAPVLAGIDRTGITQVVAAGGLHTVGLKADGTVVALGYNYYGQCDVGGWTGITQVAAGYWHTVGLKSDGTVVAVGPMGPMGGNNYGQCNVGGWTGITRVAAGYYQTVGLKSDGTVVAVGWNDYGQLNVGGWTGIVQVAGGWAHTVGLKSDGTVVAVGDNSCGQLNVGGWTDIMLVAAGSRHTVGLRSDGTVVAVGDNTNGELNVGGWTGIVQVAAGDSNTVGLKTNSTVVAVGYNDYGQCDVGGWTGITQVAAGSRHTVGLKADGTVVAVGYNTHGQCDVDDWILRVPGTYTLTISSTAGGSVTTPGEGTFTYGSGTVVNLVATPATGYRFVNWTGHVGRIADVNAAITTITMIMEGYYSITANFVAVYYDLTISSAAGGSVTTPGEGTFTREAGTVVSLVATPATGYQFVNWTAPAGSFANANAAQTTFTMPAQAVTVTAHFQEARYTLTMAVSPITGGTATDVTGTSPYLAGAIVNIKALPAAGYRFVNWTAPKGSFANANAAETTFTMPAQNVTVTAHFEAATEYTLTMVASPVTGGTATDVTGAPTYLQGEVVNIQAAAAAGYQFVNWTAPAGSFANASAATTTFTMPAQDVTVTANFEVIPPVHTLTISSTAGGSVTTPGMGTFTYHPKTVVSLVATPATGYGFVNWAGDVGTIANVNAATTTITMQGAYKISARFMAGVVAAKTETVTNSTVDAMAEADTRVVVKGTATVTVARYEDNPGGPPPTGSSSLNPLGKYIDFSSNDTTEVTETEIQLYYTDAQVTVAGIKEESLRLFWWNDTAWVQCSYSGVDTGNTNGYSGYMWAVITEDTTPSLADLQGTPWGGYGHPTEKGICFVATAAYGTDTAKEIDILRKFRDEVLLPNRLGARLISFYYRTSPPIADFISQHEALRTTVKVAFVDPIVKISTLTHGLWSARGSWA
jgi:uncharacterized repeat protein (TIGR02543 family)